MSYKYPTADFNSAGENPNPLVGTALQEAEAAVDQELSADPGWRHYNPFNSWQRLKEDVIHFTPIDDLPEKDRNRIRARRRRGYKNSAVPWIIGDYTSLLTAYDDIDDLLKTKTLIKDYALTPAAIAAKRLAKGKNPFRNEKLDGWREGCGVPAPPRQKKLIVPGFGGLNLLAALGLGALSVLFPGWRLAALLLQAAQAADSLFGVGLQLGPILGFLMESAFRGVKEVGGPIFDFDNKYEQLKAARAIRKANRILAAAPHAHPDDAMTSLTGIYYASDKSLLPNVVIDTDDYPSVESIIDDPAAIGKEAFDAARLAASLPYNLGANAVNAILGEVMENWSAMLGGPGSAGIPAAAVDNETAAIMALIEAGICPNVQCESELAMDLLLTSNYDARVIPGEREPLALYELARNLGLSVTDPRPPLPPDQTPVPEP